MKSKPVTPKLNPVAQKWVEALRSGKYKQTKRVLTSTNAKGKVVGHCCLGVLCTLAVQAGVIPPAKPKKLETYGERARYCHSYGRDVEVLPPKVRKWVGMKTSSGDWPVNSYTIDSLTAKNDNGASFKKIANMITENAAELFVKPRSK